MLSSVGYHLLESVYKKVVVILEANCHTRMVILSKVRGCRYTKLIDSRYRYNWYRYYKNAIINKDISSLVGWFFAHKNRCPFPITGTTWSLYSLSDPSPDYELIANTSHVALRLTFKEYACQGWPRIAKVIFFMHDSMSANKSDHTLT